MEYLNQLKDSEYKIIEVLNNNHHVTQRDIAQKTGLSLGLTNIMVKRLIKKGFVKIKNMNKRKILYHLTPKAMIEKTQRMYNYFERTMRDVVTIKEKIQQAILEKWNGQYSEIVIVGKDEISEIARWAVENMDGKKIRLSHENVIEKLKDNGFLVINCEKEIIEHGNCINIYKIL